MKDRYKKFYEASWDDVYGFWHQVIDRGQRQINILKKVISGLKSSTIRILDVGCGAGDEIQEALSQIKGKKFEIVANDTSKEALEKYRRNNFLFIKRTINRRLEDLPAVLREEFDFILFSHCLYGVDLDNLFDQYLKLLKDDGVALIFFDSQNSGLKTIQKKFWPAVNGTSFDESLAEDVVKILARKKIRHRVFGFPYYIYLNKLEKIKPDGLVSLFLPFALRAKNIKKDVAPKIISFIEKLAQKRKIKNQTLAVFVKK